MSSQSNDHKRKRFVPLVWLSGALAAVLLVLGVSGTLSSWTTAIITNNSNTAQAANSVILQETGPGAVVCNSTDGPGSTNAYTCSTINKYGGTATPLDPVTNTSQAVTVTLKNTGTTGGGLTLAPGTCAKTLGSVTATSSICNVALVTIKCTSPSLVDTTSTPVTLATFASTPIGTLAAGASTDCTFTVSMPSTASPQIAGQLATQPLVWTLA